MHIEANLLYTVASFNNITTPLFTYIRSDLLTWYEGLPAWMHLGTLIESDSQPAGTRRTIFLVHLFHLSANILVARLAHEQLIESSMDARTEELQTAVTDGLVAARTASRILQLQLNDQTIFQRCWCCE